MKDLVLSDLSYQFDYKDRVLNFQFILTHLNFYRLEKIITAIKLAYSVFKFRPEITNRIIKRNNEIYSYLRDFKYLNSYDAYIERLIEFINSSELKDKELMIKELSYCSKLPKERRIINILKELKEFNKDKINQENLDYLKKHPKALVLFTVEFEKDNPDDLKYIKDLIRSELTNKNPKKKLSEKVINQKIEQILKDLFNYDSIYVLVKRR